MISSPHNPRIKLARSLAGRARTRREANAFLAEGVRLVEEALASDWPFEFVLYTHDLSERGRGLIHALEQKGIAVDEVDRDLLSSLSETETSQGILAVLKELPRALPDKPDFVLILDSVRDPGNLGTLLRSAEACGVQVVLIPPETADVYSPKVVRAGMGAHFRLPIQSLDWEAIRRVTASWRTQVYLADVRGKSCWEIDFRLPLALIIGGEAEGASQEARRLAAQTIGIPMQGKSESLNAAVAGSILMFEVLRQSRSRAP